jgi:hypothetical protein
MKKVLAILTLYVVCSLRGAAQGETESFTVYKEFKPGLIHLASGKTLKNSMLNIFLKDASLLYKSGSNTMEANMDNIVGVDFDDRKYIKINKELAYLVDSVGANKLYCATLIDVEAYKTMLKNNVNMSYISISDQVQYSTIDLNPQEKQPYPVINHFYYLYNGQIIKVHEREIQRLLDKEQRRLFKTIIGEKDFSWVDEASLVRLLKAITTNAQ